MEKNFNQSVRLSRTESMQFLNIRKTKFEELKATDPDFPKAEKWGLVRNARVFYKLVDLIDYSNILNKRYEECARVYKIQQQSRQRCKK